MSGVTSKDDKPGSASAPSTAEQPAPKTDYRSKVESDDDEDDDDDDLDDLDGGPQLRPRNFG